MKKSRLAVSVVCIAAGIFLFRAGMAAGSSNAKPGTSGDPLITQSYLEQRLAEVTEDAYQKVLLTKGKRLRLAIGSEAVLYSGNAVSAGQEGLLDLTIGNLAASGVSLTQYHLYLSPDEESGIAASNSCILYVKGGYTLQ